MKIARGTLAFLLLLGAAAFGQTVVVDGDLADLTSVAKVQSDPLNDLCDLARSGFDFERVLAYYDSASDALYRIDVMDVEEGGPGIGLPGPGVPGDSDGNGDPNNGGNELCESQDQYGVGTDEFYLIKVDTNSDFTFGGASDIRIVYRSNALHFEKGDGTPAVGITGEIVLGTAGAAEDPQMPNQNRLTEDIEIAVHDWSSVDTSPETFALSVFAGSLVDGPPEDFLRPAMVVGPDDVTCRFGTVDWGSSDVPAVVLTVNGSAGDDTRTVSVAVGFPVVAFMDVPPSGPIPAPFALYVWLSVPSTTTITPHPFSLGTMCFPTPVTGGLPQPKRIWNNIGHPEILGTPYYPSDPAPSTPLSRPGGIWFVVSMTFQGIILDDGSAANKPASITNAVVLKVVE